MAYRRTLLKSGAAALALSLASPTLVQADEPIPVVATFSILGDMVRQVGGEHIALTTLVGPNGDAHVYQPTPADARAVSNAKVLFVNGLEFEGWIERLVAASDFSGMEVVATTGVDAIPFEEGDDHHDDHHDGHGHDDHKDDHAGHGHDDHKDDHAEHGHDDHKDDDHAGHGHDDHKDDDHAGHGHHGHDHGAFDPHAWQGMQNAVIYVDNIAAALAKADPANASDYFNNRAAYVAELEALDAELIETFKVLPEAKRTVVTSHDAFGYFAERYGLTFEAPQGLSTESEASAGGVARLIEQIREENISAVFVETITDNRLLEQIARETGAKIGGTLYSDALSGPDGPASTYLDMMRHNASTISSALAGS